MLPRLRKESGNVCDEERRLDLQILKRPNHMNRPQTQSAGFVAHSRVPAMIISTLGDRRDEGAPGKPQGSL